MRYMLDTNAVSAAMRGSEAMDERLLLLDAGDWCISAITHAEIRFGLALRPEATKLAVMANAFLAIASTVAWDAAAADEHGRLRASFRKAGTPIGDFDEMIAAHALSLDATLVTANVRHFERVAGLRIENWAPVDPSS